MDSRASLKDTLGCTLRNPQPFSDEFPAKAHKKPRGVLGKSRGKAQGIPAKIMENPWGIRPKTNSGIESWEMPLRICPGRCSGVLLGFPKDFPGKSRQNPANLHGFPWIAQGDVRDTPGRLPTIPPRFSGKFPVKAREISRDAPGAWACTARICHGRCSGVPRGFPNVFF